MDTSTSPELIDQSLLYREEELQTKNALNKIEPIKTPTNVINIGKTQMLQENIQENGKHTEEQSSETELENWTETERPGLVRYMESDKLSPIVETVDSAHPSLVDSSIRQLHGLMKQVGDNVQKRSRNGIELGIDPQLINAACNCAKQMAQMVKLKLEFEKIKKEK